MAGCASLCFGDSKCKFWTYNPRLDKYLTILPNISSQSVEVLDEDFRPGKESIHKGVDVRTKIMWSSRWLRIYISKHESLVGALPEKPESLPTSGVMTSPNFPSKYPNRLHERKTIKVAKGNVINIHFTDFDTEYSDYVEITDGDGTWLGRLGARHYSDKGESDEGDDGSGSGEGSGEGRQREGTRISDITSFTETVHVLFYTDASFTMSGWRLEWSK